MAAGQVNTSKIAEYPERPVLQEDLEYVAAAQLNYEAMRGASVLVTGATGLIGSLLVKSLACINRVHHLDMHIFGLARNEDKAKIVFGRLLEREDISLILADLTDDSFGNTGLRGRASEQRFDYIFHCVAVTTSRTMVERPVETIEAALTGTKRMLELARSSRAKGFVYISSMEVYGDMSVYAPAASDTAAKDRAGYSEAAAEDRIGYSEAAAEDRIGYIDPLKVRSNYPESKRMCENMCVAYSSEYGVPVKIARLSQTFGAGILPWENRVFAQFARSAVLGSDIVLHTKGLSEGNYCYTADCMRGLMTILLKGEPGQAYNVVNEETHTTIRDMAQLVAKNIAGGNIKVVFDIPESNLYGYAADTRLRLDGAKLRSLGWTPATSLEDAYRRMIESDLLPQVADEQMPAVVADEQMPAAVADEQRPAARSDECGCDQHGQAYLRQADADDALLLLEWRNDAEVRNNSFHHEQVEQAAHLAWYEALLKDPLKQQYILMVREPETEPSQSGMYRAKTRSDQNTASCSAESEDKYRPAGQIRLSLTPSMTTDKAAYCAEIGYSIAQEERGKGYGRMIIRLTEELIRNECPRIRFLTASVLKHNTASRKVFQANGFAESESVTGDQPSWHYIKRIR